MAIVELVLQDAGESISEEINDDQVTLLLPLPLHLVLFYDMTYIPCKCERNVELKKCNELER